MEMNVSGAWHHQSLSIYQNDKIAHEISRRQVVRLQLDTAFFAAISIY